jgi:hypothetical protein
MTPRFTSVARYARLALCALPLAACAIATVGSYSDRALDLSAYRTYAWGPADTDGTGDPRLDNNRFFEERVRGQVEQRLSARGFEKTEAATPDLLVHYHASFSEKIDVREIDRSYASSIVDRQPVVYDAGTIFVDLVDARAKTLVWRGWMEGTMDGAIDNQAWLEARVDDAVMRILRRLPAGARDNGGR